MHLLMTSELGIPDLKSIPTVRPRARCFPALNHIWGKQAPPRHREAVVFPHCRARKSEADSPGACRAPGWHGVRLSNTAKLNR